MCHPYADQPYLNAAEGPQGEYACAWCGAERLEDCHCFDEDEPTVAEQESDDADSELR